MKLRQPKPLVGLPQFNPAEDVTGKETTLPSMRVTRSMTPLASPAVDPADVPNVRVPPGWLDVLSKTTVAAEQIVAPAKRTVANAECMN